MKINWKYLAIAVISVAIMAFLGSLFTGPNTSSDWYQSIKPSLTPPNWVFPIAWNILFILIAISFYIALATNSNSKERKKIYIAFYINFILNVLWSVLYFGLKNPLLSFIEIIILWASIWFMIYASYKVDKEATFLLIPYLLWVGFAAILNYLSI
jgi:benzodiazapine receptor